MVKKTLSRLAAPHVPADLLFKRNALRESHWNPLAKACADAMALPFWLNDNPVITTSQIKGDLQDIQARCGSVSLVIVDYVQLIEPMRRERGENRVQEIDSILKQLRAIAKQFNCAVLGLGVFVAIVQKLTLRLYELPVKSFSPRLRRTLIRAQRTHPAIL